MTQDDLPAILLTRVQQVYAILVSVADTPNTIAADREGHSKDGVVSALEYASELNDDQRPSSYLDNGSAMNLGGPFLELTSGRLA